MSKVGIESKIHDVDGVSIFMAHYPGRTTTEGINEGAPVFDFETDEDDEATASQAQTLTFQSPYSSTPYPHTTPYSHQHVARVYGMGMSGRQAAHVAGSYLGGGGVRPQTSYSNRGYYGGYRNRAAAVAPLPRPHPAQQGLAARTPWGDKGYKRVVVPAYSDTMVKAAFPGQDVEKSKEYLRRHEERWVRGYFPDLDSAFDGYQGEIAFDVSKYDTLEKLRDHIVPFKVNSLLDDDRNVIALYPQDSPDQQLPAHAAFVVGVSYNKDKRIKETKSAKFVKGGLFGQELTYFPAVLMKWAPYSDFFAYIYDLHDESKKVVGGIRRHAYIALDLLKQILLILDAMHKNGVTHRDIKNENLLITGYKTEEVDGKTVEEKFEKYFGYLARCQETFCTTTLKKYQFSSK